MSLLFGIDTLLQQADRHVGQRIGMVTNDAATTVDGRKSRAALIGKGFHLVKLFSPEHGLDAAGADGAFMHHLTDRLTGLPVISLYGDALAPQPQDLADVDLVFFDLPDVGCRFYTYQWTLSHVMEACALHHMPLIVCDRPNPIGGNLRMAEGPMPDPTCASFIGRWDIPIRHSCTIGELALLWQRQHTPSLQLQVMPVQGWSRRSLFSQLQLPFVPTSPGIPDAETALLYPGMGLLEAMNVNEGRGTATPFKVCGAPWMDGKILSDGFNSLGLPGLHSIPVSYTTVAGRHAHQLCHGIRLLVDDATAVRPVMTGLWLLWVILRTFPDDAAAATYPTRANPTGERHLELLTGVPSIWTLLGKDEATFRSQLKELLHTDAWQHLIADQLLYA